MGLPAELDAKVRAWGHSWGLPNLADSIHVEFSSRMRRSLGRCRPASGRVRMASFLLEGSPEILEEVACHEIAHVAAYQLHGERARPHGREWEALVKQAGFEPRVRAPAALGPDESQVSAHAPRVRDPGPRYQHRCPVCHSVRWSSRPVPAWHCAECLDAGLDGKMVISRVPS